jgi:hypothetical protein
MIDESGINVSNSTFWRSTMMANAARDPYWQASLRGEVLSNLEYREAIEDKCATCHTPMARFTESVEGVKGQLLDDGYLNPDNNTHTLAMDGVSCTLCHQIQPANLGDPESFSGGYAIDPDSPPGERTIFGPYAVDDAQAAVMQAASGFAPAQGMHVGQSELCATCHTLYTPTIDDSGEIVGEFPEQTPYLEWLNSGYRDTRSCQSCHMPPADGGVVLSVTGGQPRSPFSKHVFVGGNAYMLGILNEFGEELGVTATSEQFEATIQRTLEQLQNRTARVQIQSVDFSNGRLLAEINVESQVGHKFPSGYPARRAWLHFVVRDASGAPVFESGSVRADGSIEGNNNDADGATYEPHYQLIESGDQVQIYEAIIGDAAGSVTTTLMRGAGYLKDNRLLPQGFDMDTAPEDIAVRGEAVVDPDFLGGSDVIRYRVDLSQAKSPFSVTVELLYQSIGYRWVENLRRHEAPEIARFLGYYETVSNLPVVVASDSLDVQK